MVLDILSPIRYHTPPPPPASVLIRPIVQYIIIIIIKHFYALFSVKYRNTLNTNEAFSRANKRFGRFFFFFGKRRKSEENATISTESRVEFDDSDWMLTRRQPKMQTINESPFILDWSCTHIEKSSNSTTRKGEAVSHSSPIGIITRCAACGTYTHFSTMDMQFIFEHIFTIDSAMMIVPFSVFRMRTQWKGAKHFDNFTKRATESIRSLYDLSLSPPSFVLGAFSSQSFSFKKKEKTPTSEYTNHCCIECDFVSVYVHKAHEI